MDSCFTLAQGNLGRWFSLGGHLSVLCAVVSVRSSDNRWSNSRRDRIIAKASAAEETLLAWGPV